MNLSRFWRERQADFEKYQEQFPHFRAYWHAQDQAWVWQAGRRFEGSPEPSHPAFDAFKPIAQKIVSGWLTFAQRSLYSLALAWLQLPNRGRFGLT